MGNCADEVSPGRRDTSNESSRARSPPICRFMQPTEYRIALNLKTAKALA